MSVGVATSVLSGLPIAGWPQVADSRLGSAPMSSSQERHVSPTPVSWEVTVGTSAGYTQPVPGSCP